MRKPLLPHATPFIFLPDCTQYGSSWTSTPPPTTHQSFIRDRASYYFGIAIESQTNKHAYRTYSTSCVHASTFTRNKKHPPARHLIFPFRPPEKANLNPISNPDPKNHPPVTIPVQPKSRTFTSPLQTRNKNRLKSGLSLPLSSSPAASRDSATANRRRRARALRTTRRTQAHLLSLATLTCLSNSPETFGDQGRG